MSLLDMIPVFITTRRGGSGGIIFSDALLIGDIATAAIKQITIRHEGIVYGLKVKYTWNESASETEIEQGTRYGTTTVLDFDDDEFITGVEGYSSQSYITQLTFVTNKRRFNPQGVPDGELFQWGDIGTHQGTHVPRVRLLAFSGAVATHLVALQGIFFDSHRRDVPIMAANYQGIPAGPGSEGSLSSVVPLATFTSHLKTPVITLYIGPDRVEFHAHEDTLCKVPFFQAALQGSFREALAKSIEMPEDAPGPVSALIEFLYMGNYTYTYDSSTTTKQGRPIPNLAEGQYHISVFVIATKYDCAGLAAIAIGNFESLLPELDSVDTLRLWKHGYAEGPDLQTWRNHFERCHGGKWVVRWVKELFKNHRQEMEETIAESPELASDLMRVAICGK